MRAANLEDRSMVHFSQTETNYLDAQQYTFAIVRDALRGMMHNDKEAVAQSTRAFKASYDFLRTTAALHHGGYLLLPEADMEHMEQRLSAWCSQTNCGVCSFKWECN
jgi:hypothetical protein